MEKSRAIELLKLAVPIKALTQQEYADFVEAVNMAIDALKEQLSKQCTTSDLISRQAAIDAVRASYDEILDFKSTGRTVADSVEDIISELPPAQPEPKEGHWIPHETPDGGEQYECSRCGVLWEFNDGTPEDNEAYFCPNCGAKMKGAQNG